MLGFTFTLTLTNAQDKQLGITYGPDLPLLGPDKTSKTVPAKQLSAQVKSLVQQQKAAKLAGNTPLILSIQKQIDALTGESVTVPAIQTGGSVVNTNSHFNGNDNIINDEIFITPAGTFLKGMATATEQRGSNVGKIWLSYAYGSSSSSSPDTILFFNSTNNGTSWSFYASALFGSNSKVNYDEMDMEIMEYTTGQKYVWTTLGVTANNGQSFAVGVILQTPTFAGNIFTLVWPGGLTNTNYYRPRVTSDNSNYPTSSSYLFMIAGRDTLSAANTHKTGEKFVECQNPFTVTPTFTYKASALYYDLNYGGTGNYYADHDHCDIAYYSNGGQDSLIMLESNVPDTSVIYCMKSDELPMTSAVTQIATLNGGNTAFPSKQFARVTSNGNNVIMIAYRDNFNNSGDWDIRYAKSTNGGVIASAWSNGYIDGTASTVTYPYQPDLTGLRGTSSFKCSYVYFNSGIDSAMIINAPNGTWEINPTRMSLTGQDVSTLASSHAGYRFVNNDSCLVAWSNYSANNVWVSKGCSGGTLTGINHNNNEIPKTYSLSQNYPNPFNPTTNIKFSIPKNSVVKLTIYDLTGRVVETLVDGQLNAGNYAYDFDASNIASGVYFYKLQSDNFTDVKKMMLIK